MKKTTIALIIALVVCALTAGAFVAAANHLDTPDTTITTTANTTSDDDKEIAELLKEIEDLQSLNEELQSTINELNANNVNLMIDKAVLENTLAMLKNIISDMKTEISTLKTVISTLQADNTELKVAVAVLETNLTTLNSTFTQLLSENTTLKDDLNLLEEELAVLEAFLEQKDATIKELTELKNGITKRVHITNSFWEYSGSRNAKTGTIWFDDLSNVDKITVSYKDEFFDDIIAPVSSFVLDKEKNIGIVSFVEDIRGAIIICQYEVFYKDGRTETITERIIMG